MGVAREQARRERGVGSDDRPAPLRPVAWQPVGAVAAVVGGLLLATGGSYGYHRDELYFLMLRPSWGYRDQPPLTPLLAKAASAVFGSTPWGLRIPAMVCAVATLLLSALLARELGGGRAAQTLAAAGVGLGATTLIFGHVLLTATVDLVAWVAVTLCAARALLRNEPRWWLPAGAVVGLGLYNKLLIVLLLGGMAVGLVVLGPRRVFTNRWLWVGAALAVLIGLPNLVYQLSHGLPQGRMAAAISANGGATSRALFVPFQLVLLGPPLVPIWLAGLVGLLRRRAWRPVRWLAASYLAVAAVVLLTGGQPYYTYGLIVALFAAGAVVTADWMRDRPRRLGLVGIGTALNAAVSALVALPLVPLSALGSTPIPVMNQTARDSVGWPAYVDEVVRTYDALPASERAHAVVITANYGEAGALVRLGGARLPRIYSGHNELWYYGPPPATATVAILVGTRGPSNGGRLFASCTPAGRLDNHVGVDNEEQGRPITVCRDPTGKWGALWPAFQHFD